ncbi:glycoside hydrolase family 3 N-terminal domain-containing protein [Luedemannella flava]|uniref:beta-glucosidase n=1 Tax=Luedemannella flava TaxID=349316 RepID=A0ABP4XSU7_9ACTN
MAAAAAVTVIVARPADAAAGLPYQDPAQPVATRVADLLARMSLDDKIGQMTQASRNALQSQQDIATYKLGSLLSGGGEAPGNNSASGWADMYDSYQRTALTTSLAIPIIYGLDAVHGNNNVYGATVFPHNIGLGAARDPDLVQRVGRATAEEVAGAGLDWTFAPCLCVARNDRWGRTYESYGEKPEIGVSYAPVITGLQGTTLGGGSASILATAKHYIGDGGTTNGTDQGNTQISESELRSVHLPPFKAAIERGVGSVMISYSSFNGVKLHGHKYLITDVLKTELGFTGFVVSDWAGVDQIDGGQGFTQSEVAAAVNAGIDMVMVPTDYRTFISHLRNAVNAGQVPQSRIDDAVKRILTKKFELGLFEQPLSDRTYTSSVGSQAHRDIAREAVRKSQVLLKNANNVLPLAKTGKYFVAGKSADNIGNQAGGWTISWQGASGNIIPGTTILQGIRQAASGATVNYSADGSGIDSSYTAAIAVVGETPYAEGRGDRTGSMSLDSTDLGTISRLRAAGVPVIVVLVSGRPLDIASEVGNWNALLASWLPGSEGAGVADVLFGSYNPTGKLPVTWMSSVSQQPINDGDGKTGLYPYGYGLSYTTVPPTSTPPTSAVPTSAAPTSRPPTSRPPTSAVPTTTRPPTSAVPTSAVPTTTRPPTSAAPTTGSASCTVTYKVAGQWQGGFQGDVTIRNNGSAALSNWTLAWTYANGQTITQLWNASHTQSGSSVTVKGLSWNSTIAPSGTVNFGFLGSWTGTNAVPGSFTLNGSPCGVA